MGVAWSWLGPLSEKEAWAVWITKEPAEWICLRGSRSFYENAVSKEVAGVGVGSERGGRHSEEFNRRIGGLYIAIFKHFSETPESTRRSRVVWLRSSEENGRRRAPLRGVRGVLGDCYVVVTGLSR